MQPIFLLQSRSLWGWPLPWPLSPLCLFQKITQLGHLFRIRLQILFPDWYCLWVWSLAPAYPWELVASWGTSGQNMGVTLGGYNGNIATGSIVPDQMLDLLLERDLPEQGLLELRCLYQVTVVCLHKGQCVKVLPRSCNVNDNVL